MKVSKSIVLGLAVMFVSTACSSKQSDFTSGKAKTRVLKSEDSAAAKVEIEKMEGFEASYAKAAEDYLNTSYSDYMADMVSKVEKHLGSDTIEVDGVTIDDPSALVADLADLMASSDNMYETPREYLEDMESSVDTTNYQEVKEYLASEKDALTEVKEVFAEVDFANFKIVGEGSSESSEESSQESFSLVCGTAVSTPYGSATTTVSASASNDGTNCTTATSAPAAAKPVASTVAAQAAVTKKKTATATAAAPATPVTPQNIAASQTLVQNAQPLAINGENASNYASAAVDGISKYITTNGVNAQAQSMQGNVDQIVSLGLSDALLDLSMLGIMLR